VDGRGEVGRDLFGQMLRYLFSMVMSVDRESIDDRFDPIEGHVEQGAVGDGT